MMEKDTGIKDSILRVDGGAAMNTVQYFLLHPTDLLNKSVEKS